MKNIILIQPRIGDLDDVNKHPFLPLGLLSTSRFISRDYNIKIIDQRINKNWRKELKKELNKKTLFVALTVMTGPQVDSATKISKFIRKHSDTQIVWGGPHATHFEKTISHNFIDIVVIGEGELTFYELANALKEERSLVDIKGIVFKKHDKIIRNPERSPIRMDILPTLPLNLIDVKLYTSQKPSFWTFDSSRGCPHDCIFCRNSAPFLHSQWRGFSAKSMYERVKHLLKHKKTDYIWFIDDNFFADIKRIKSFIRIIKENRLKFKWIVSGTFDVLANQKDSFFSDLHQSGCRMIHMGIESGSSKIVKFLKNKELNKKKILALNKKLKKYRIIPYYNFMVGNYKEKISDVKKTAKFMLKLQKDYPNARFSVMYSLALYPHTKLFNYLLDKNIIKPNKDDKSYANWDTPSTPWITSKMQKLIEGFTFCSLFFDKKYQLVDSKYVKLFAFLYRPIALFRVKNMYFNHMPEKRLKYIFN